MTTYTDLATNVNATSLGDLLKFANVSTGDTFWSGVYWMVIAVIFFSSVAFGWEIAVMMAFFGGMILGIFLLYLDLISITLFGMTEAILIFMIIYFMYSSRSQQQ